MKFARNSVVISCLFLGACGTYIPSQRDWPNGSARQVVDMNSVLLHSIVCELSYAVTLSIENDLDQAKTRRNHRSYSSFLKDWGVEVATDLTVSESSTVNPTGIWMPKSPMSAVFSVGGGVSGGSTASNENKYNVFYPISDLYKPEVFHLNSIQRPCRDPRGNKEGSPLVDIDLQILPLLESRIQVVQLGFASEPTPEHVIQSEKNVLTQTVSIKQSVAGDITPTWKFSTGAVDQSGKLFGTGRDRTHQVVFTFGPMADGKKSLTPLGEAFHLNQQLQAGLQNSETQR